MTAVSLQALAGEWRTVVIGQLSFSEIRRAVTEPIMILLNARMCVVIASPLFVLPSFIFFYLEWLLELLECLNCGKYHVLATTCKFTSLNCMPLRRK